MEDSKSKITPTEKLVSRIRKMRNVSHIIEWKRKGEDLVATFEAIEERDEGDEMVLNHGRKIVDICQRKLEKLQKVC